MSSENLRKEGTAEDRIDMLRLNSGARVMLTDSGGLQEECILLGTPCLTLRWNTERPITLKEHGGASVLVGNNVERIRKEYRTALAKARTPIRPQLWDGHTAERYLQAILNASSTRHCESDEGGRGNLTFESSL